MFIIIIKQYFFNTFPKCYIITDTISFVIIFYIALIGKCRKVMKLKCYVIISLSLKQT